MNVMRMFKKSHYKEAITGIEFDRYECEIIEAEYQINRLYSQAGYISLNTYLELLGLDKTDNGEDLGWSYDLGYDWLDFDKIKTEKDMILFSPVFWPVCEYNNEFC